MYNVDEENENREISLTIKDYEIKPEVLCKACQKAFEMLHPTKEQAQKWLDSKKDYNGVLNMKSDDTLVAFCEKEIQQLQLEDDIKKLHKQCKRHYKK